MNSWSMGQGSSITNFLSQFYLDTKIPWIDTGLYLFQIGPILGERANIFILMGDLLYHRRNLLVCISYYTFLLCFTTCFGY
jgi:hypothetical protein